MPQFRYKAVTASGESVEGAMESPDRAAVIAHLQAAGHIPIRADEIGWHWWSALPAARRGAAPSQRDLLLFTQQLANLLHAGLPLDRCLQVMLDVAASERVRRLVLGLRDAVARGASLSEALQAQRGVFSRLYVNMVLAGEASGALAVALERLAEYLARARALRENIVSALTYPAILVAVAAASVSILLGYVVPKFQELFDDLGSTLPLATRVVVMAANAVRDWGWLGFLLILGGAWFARRRLRDASVRRHWEARLLRLPFVGELVCKAEMARLSRALATLLISGVPLLRALGIAQGAVGNGVLADALAGACERLKQGRSLAASLGEAGVFPPLTTQMVKVGEETGRLDAMLARLAELYDQEVGTSLQRLLALLEPALIVGLGLVVGFIVLSILLAIMSLNALAV